MEGRKGPAHAGAGPGGEIGMELNIESQKQEFLSICRACIQREGAED